MSTNTNDELRISGNKKLSTLMQEFNDRFPFLCINFFNEKQRPIIESQMSEYPRDQKAITPLDFDSTIASVRRKETNGTISMRGNRRIETFEKEFDEEFGLLCKVGWTVSGKSYYSSNLESKVTLAALNEEGETQKFKKMWHWL